MIKKKHQLRFGKELYIVENMDKDNYLLRNLTTNDIEWVSKKNISEALEKITFNQSLMEYSSQNDFIKISLLENGDSTTIDVNDGINHYYKSYKNGKTKVLEQFTKKFNYFNELTPQKLLNNGFTTSLKQPLLESFGGQIFYHGSHTKNIKNFEGNVFWSTTLDFAEQYGPIIYKAQLNLGNCFNISIKQHFNWLLKQVGGKITYKDDNEEEQYLFDFNDYCKIANNNWETVEQYLDIIKGSFDSCQIAEEDIVNYIVFNNNQIRLIDVFNRQLDESVSYQTGQPLKIIGYHGTQNDFENFDRKFAKDGFYFCTKERLYAMAGYYAQDNGFIIKAELTLNNPYVCPSDELSNKTYDKIVEKGYDGIISLASQSWNHNYYNFTIDKLDKETIDINDVVEIIVFEPSQIKVLGKYKPKEVNESVQPNLNDNFWKWFQGSKVVDEDGNPLVVIHRTKNDFNTFDISKSHPMNLQGKGFYFSTNDDLVMKKSYGNIIMKCYLSIKNPFYGYGVQYEKSMLENYIPNNTLQIIFEGNDSKTFEGYELFFGLQMSRAERNVKGHDIDTSEILKKIGFDGIYLSENNVWIAFEPNQIKSVNNNGEWNSNNDNINESIITEDYHKDKEYRTLAKKLADIIAKKINSKDEMFSTENDLVYDVTKEFYKASDLIKNSGKQYAVIFSQATSHDGTPSFAASKDETRCYIFFPILSLPNQELMVELFKKNKKAYQEFLIQYTNAPKEEQPNILRTAFIKLAKKYVKKRMKHFTEERDDIVVHECIHLIDYLRRTKGYVPAKQDIGTEKGKANYYNSPEEQNAYYQETVHNFDHWINQDKSGIITFLFDTNDFREFFKAFVQQYQGDYSKLNKENKVKIAKRVYQYWLNAFEINSNKSLKNRKTLGESITVYHGSNADFDKFDSQYIGNEDVGEGRQRHGWGFYFALNKNAVTRAYSKRITGRHLNSPKTEQTFIFRNKSYKFGSAMYKILEIIQENGEEKAIEYINSVKNENNAEKVDKLIDMIHNLTEEDKTDIRLMSGQFYKVEIPDFKYFLDEERYYNDWFEVDENNHKKDNTYMKNAIKKALTALGIENTYNYKNRNGVRIYNKIADIFKSKGSNQSYKDTSLFLNKFGIKGVTYHDHNDGRCFVVFNDKDIKIIDKDIKPEETNELKLDDETLMNEIKAKIKKNPNFIATINNPSEELIKYALSLNPDVIKYIKNPSETVLNYLNQIKQEYQEKMEKNFINMTKAHHNLVNQFGAKVGKSYPQHDFDKFKQPLLSKYCLDWKKKYYGLNQQEKELFRQAMEEHHKSQTHHPEYWGKAGGHGRIHVENIMPDDAIIEMCADWCAKAKEYGNTPFEWADENIGKKWKFDKHQIDLIYKTLKQMWSKSNNDKPINESIDDKIEIKNEQADDKILLTLFLNNNKIGHLKAKKDYNEDMNIIDIDYFEIDEKFRNKGFGQLLVKKLINLYQPTTIVADVLSKQSYKSLYKVLGEPYSYTFNNDTNDYENHFKYLPNDANEWAKTGKNKDINYMWDLTN